MADTKIAERRVPQSVLDDIAAALSQTILDLTDTPSAYTGQAGKALIVKLTEDGFEFGDAGSSVLTRTTYTSAGGTTADEDIAAITATSASPIYILLATADLADGKTFVIKDEGGGAGTGGIVIAGEGGETIDGMASVTITVDYGILRVYSDGANWFTW